MMRLQRLTQAVLIALFFLTSPSKIASAQAPVGPEGKVYLPAVFRNFDPEWSMGEPQAVDLSPYPRSQPYLVIDTRGRVHIFWDTYSGSGAFIYHMYSTGKGWSEPVPVALSLGISELRHSPLVGKDGRIHLIWRNELTYTGPYRILYSEWDGNHWSSEFALVSDGGNMNIDGIIRRMPDGRLKALVDLRTGQKMLYFSQKAVGSEFSGSTEVTKPEYSPTVLLDSQGGIRFYESYFYTNVIQYSYWKDGQYAIYNQPVTGQMYGWTPFIDGTESLHIFKSGSVPALGSVTNGIRHACTKNDFRWSPEEVISGVDRVLSYSLSFSEDYQPVVAWSQNNYNTISAREWESCDREKSRTITLPALPDGAQWGEFQAVARSEAAHRVCLLSRQLYNSSKYWVTCSGMS